MRNCRSDAAIERKRITTSSANTPDSSAGDELRAVLHLPRKRAQQHRHRALRNAQGVKCTGSSGSKAGTALRSLAL